MNQGTEEFKIKYFIKQRAVQIKRAIVNERENIKKYFRMAELCTIDDHKRAEIMQIVEDCKDRKRELLFEFEQLKL